MGIKTFSKLGKKFLYQLWLLRAVTCYPIKLQKSLPEYENVCGIVKRSDTGAVLIYCMHSWFTSSRCRGWHPVSKCLFHCYSNDFAISNLCRHSGSENLDDPRASDLSEIIWNTVSQGSSGKKNQPLFHRFLSPVVWKIPWGCIQWCHRHWGEFIVAESPKTTHKRKASYLCSEDHCGGPG